MIVKQIDVEVFHNKMSTIPISHYISKEIFKFFHPFYSQIRSEQYIKAAPNERLVARGAYDLPVGDQNFKQGIRPGA